MSDRSRLNIEIPSSPGCLTAFVHLPEWQPAPTLVCCHGLLSSKDGSKFQWIGEAFRAAGFAVVRFDFTGCGASSTTPLETLLATRLRDLGAVIDYCRDQPWWNGRLVLLGSSFGGYVSLLTAAAQPGLVQALACWATPFDLTEIRRKLEEKPQDLPPFPPRHRLGEPETLHHLPALQNVLVIHGGRDELVPQQDAIEIYRRLGEPRRLIVMSPADHRFVDPAWRRQAVARSMDWLKSRGRESGTKG